MSDMSDYPDLKEINALKKQLTWGDVPPIFQLASAALSDLDGILSHGFDSAFRQILDKSKWNLKLLEGYQDNLGNIQVKKKPQIVLKHVYSEQTYELHCFPHIDGENIYHAMFREPECPFEQWAPESMQILFRVNNLIPFITFAFHNGDEADMALIKFAHLRILSLLTILMESFEVVDVIGYNVAEFCQELSARHQPHTNG